MCLSSELPVIIYYHSENRNWTSRETIFMIVQIIINDWGLLLLQEFRDNKYLTTQDEEY